MKGIAVAGVVIIASVVAVAYFSQAFAETYETRQFTHSTNFDPSLTQFYEGEFRVLSSEAESDRPPEVLIEVLVFDTGNDVYNIIINYAIYETDLATYDSLNDTSREQLLVDSRRTWNAVNDRIILLNSPMVYVWVIWFEAQAKTNPWSLDITLSLLYNWTF
ncbi:MAG: hypothetical protein ACXABY_23745 [Candidatus Thorarchaeota archaeon]